MISDVKTILVAVGALVIGLILGNIRGETVGFNRGYAECQEANRKATEAANERVRQALNELESIEAREAEKEAAAKATIANDPGDECRDLTPEERNALDQIGAD